jgi:hypothetical protein
VGSLSQGSYGSLGTDLCFGALVDDRVKKVEAVVALSTLDRAEANVESFAANLAIAVTAQASF